jgi:VanZ family protein
MPAKIKKYITYQFPWQFFMLVIFLQSSSGQISLPDIGIDWFDKIVHFIVFGILAVLTLRGLKHADNPLIQNHFVWISILACIVFGGIDEIHQLFVPGRFGSVSDWIADILGIAGFSFVYLFHHR